MVTARRRNVALTVAALADAVQLGMFPAFVEGALSIPDDALDAVVVAVLLATLGFRWRLLAALAVELVPGAALFPTWTALVLSVPIDATSARPERGPSRAPPVLESSEPR